VDDRALRALLKRINDLERQAVRYRQGVVTDDSPLSVALGGADTPYTDVRVIAGAEIEVGNQIAALTFGNDMLVLGGLAAALGIPRVTSLPPDPVDGQEVIYVASAADGVLWHLKYNAGSASAYKWEFVGGGELASGPLGDITTASTGYVALTSGPSIVLPLAGDYIGHLTIQTVAAAANVGYETATLHAGATGLGLNVINYSTVNGEPFMASSRAKLPGRAAGDVMTIKVACANAGSVRYVNGSVLLVPVRVG
jgi:hypothetical protein